MKTNGNVVEQISPMDELTIRRHRLTERLFADVFETPEEIWEREACQLERQSILSEEAVEAICAFLGHPPACPHGKPIPPGRCCRILGSSLEPFVIPLHQARLSDSYRIVFVAPKGKLPLERLAVLGIYPGVEIQVRQKEPALVVRTARAEIALDPEIVKEIYVKRMEHAFSGSQTG